VWLAEVELSPEYGASDDLGKTFDRRRIVAVLNQPSSADAQADPGHV